MSQAIKHDKGKPFIYGSVCSGIEAASVAWEPLGWKPAFFAEIEKFPSQVLSHHYGSNMPDEKPSANGVPNYGDITKFENWKQHAIDLLVGGTPCQDFSIAGLRAGLDGERGNLSLVFASIVRKYRPRWLVWENVPGVLSSNGGKDFASILGLLSGRSITAPKNGWKNAGYIAGYQNAYGLAWRVLDAQYTRVDGFDRAVPQRRRRIFLVGYIGGDWRPPTAVFFERKGLSGSAKPSRETRQGIAKGFEGGTNGNSQPLTFNRQSMSEYGDQPIASTVLSRDAGHPTDLVVENQTFMRKEFSGYGDETIASTMKARDYKDVSDLVLQKSTYVCTFGHTQSNGLGIHKSDVSNTLERTASCNQAVAFDCLAGGNTGFAIGDVAGALHGVGRTAVYSLVAPVASCLDAQFGSKQGLENQHVNAGCPLFVGNEKTIRRLTPVECERLMGFPDNYTKISDKTADGPRYKALGNSMAVNCMRWIGRRIELVENILKETAQ